MQCVKTQLRSRNAGGVHRSRYPGVNHGFHNDTTPRYDKAAADLAWERTLAWFNKYLR
ncbi:dienelactone hydrolase family protein [Citrobacter braakii]|uniref:dienelactone hydrolase family protein n=1 Tax=Citrobacter braakii TaxID=57706 RepID=UPI00215DBCFC